MTVPIMRDPLAVIEDAEFLASNGVDDYEAAHRLGYSENGLTTVLHRNHRDDLLDRLRRNRRELNPVTTYGSHR